MKVLKEVFETASWMPIVVVVTMTDLLLRGNPENGIAGAEKRLRDEFEQHPGTKAFWDQLETDFIFVSKGMRPENNEPTAYSIHCILTRKFCQRRRP